MLRSEAVTIIKRGLGFRQTQDASIIAALQEAQRDAESGHTLPAWIVNFGGSIEVEANHPFVVLPDDFLRMHDDFPLQYIRPAPNNTAQIFIPRLTYTDFRRIMTGSELGSLAIPTAADFPSGYILLSNRSLQLVPIPTNDIILLVIYYAAQPVLDSDIENNWLKYAPNYLIGLAGVKVAQSLRDRGAMEKFNTMAQLGHKGLMGEIIEQELVGRTLIMGRNN